MVSLIVYCTRLTRIVTRSVSEGHSEKDQLPRPANCCNSGCSRRIPSSTETGG